MYSKRSHLLDGTREAIVSVLMYRTYVSVSVTHFCLLIFFVLLEEKEGRHVKGRLPPSCYEACNMNGAGLGQQEKPAASQQLSEGEGVHSWSRKGRDRSCR